MHAWLKKILAIATVTAAVTLAPVRDADAALNAYLNLKGQKSGEIKGDGSVRKAKAKATAGGGLEVLAFSYEIKSPRDSATGQRTGQAKHSAFHITLEFDTNIIAVLIGMMTSGETLQGSIAFTTEKKGGKQQEYLKYELKDCMITSYQISSATGGRDVIILDLAPKSFEAKTADGTVFASSNNAAIKKLTHKTAE